MVITKSQLNKITNKIVNVFKKNPDDASVHLMIKSWEDYGCHALNVFRDSLNGWSRRYAYQQTPFDFRTINIDKDDIGIYNDVESLKHSRRLFFVNTTVKQLKQYHLEDLINNENAISCYYMSPGIDMDIYNFYENVA